jgi:hypothetical protein
MKNLTILPHDQLMFRFMIIFPLCFMMDKAHILIKTWGQTQLQPCPQLLIFGMPPP